MKKLFLVLFTLTAALGCLFPLMAADDDASSDKGIYAAMTDFLYAQRPSGMEQPLTAQDAAVYIVVDVLVAFVCLWVALYFMSGQKIVEFKRYFWFFIALNIGWFVILYLNYFFWGMLDYLVLRLRPEYKNELLNFFFVAIIVESAVLYIWLLARNFSLDFIGAAGTFVISQAIFFIIFFIFSIAAPKNSTYCVVVNNHIGFLPSLHGYLRDAAAISSHGGVMSLIRLRFYHL